MKYVYVQIGSEWEDLVIYLNEDEAIQISIRKPNSRIEIFEKPDDFNGYLPTYKYYKNGLLCSIN